MMAKNKIKRVLLGMQGSNEKGFFEDVWPCGVFYASLQ